MFQKTLVILVFWSLFSSPVWAVVDERYMLQEQPMFTVRYAPTDRTISVFLTGKPLVEAKSGKATVTARTSPGSEPVKLQPKNNSGVYVIPPELFKAKQIQIDVRSGTQKEVFTLPTNPP